MLAQRAPSADDIAGFGRDGGAALDFQQHAQPFSHDPVIVGQDDADLHFGFAFFKAQARSVLNGSVRRPWPACWLRVRQ